MSLIFYGYLGWVLVKTSGHFNVQGVIGLVCAVALYAGLRFWPGLKRELGARPFELLVALWVFWECRLLWGNHGLIYAESMSWLQVLVACIGTAAVVALVRLILTIRTTDDRARLVADSLLFAVLLAAKAAALLASPEPRIDVFTITRDALGYLARGLNPYVQSYVDIYSGRYGYAAGANYWPGLFWPLLPFQRLFGDFRVAYVVGDALTAAAIYRLLAEAGWRRHLARLAALCWLAFPVTFFVLEQAWVDALMIPFIAWGAVYLQRRNWLAAGALLGYACSIKQYGVVFCWFALLWAARNGKGAALRLGAAGVAIFSGVVLPFAAWDPKSFYEGTIEIFFRQPLRADALSLPAFLLVRHSTTLPAALRLGSAGLLIGLLLPIWLARRPLREGVRDWAAACALAYAFTFVVTQNAFCNYYYFAAFFALIASFTQTNQRPAFLASGPQDVSEIDTAAHSGLSSNRS